MRKFLCTVIISICFAQAFTQNVGIGISNPLARFHVSDSNVVFTGPSYFTFPATTSYSPPVQGSGARMLWYAQKAAFRMGIVSGRNWDKDSIGRFSFATGFDTKAKGEAAVAMGTGSFAMGTNAIALGYGCTASALNSVSLGEQNRSTGEVSFTMGSGSIASGELSTAIGNFAEARGVLSTAIGYGSVAQGNWSVASGYRANSIADFSTAIGFGAKSRSPYSLAIGIFNDTSNTNRIFEIGIGTAENARANALTVLNNGNIGIGNTNPTRPISFQPFLGEKILLYPGAIGEVGIGVYGNELRLHCDNPGSTVSFGTQDYAGNFTQAARAQITGAYAFIVNGSIWANGVTYASDARFKTNITAIESPLEKLLKLNGVEYDMKHENFEQKNFPSVRQIGLIAQNVEQVVPEAVSELEGYKAVDYAKLVPLLIESIKEQQKQIDTLKRMLEAKNK